jgi:hypothetical protein
MLFLPISLSAAEPGRTAAFVPPDYAKNGHLALSFGVGDVHGGLGVTAEFRYRHIGFFLSKATLPFLDVTGGVKYFLNPNASGLIVSVYGSYLHLGAGPGSTSELNSVSEVAFTLGMRHRFAKLFLEWGVGYGYGWQTSLAKPSPEYPNPRKSIYGGFGMYGMGLPTVALTIGSEL